MAEGDHGKEKAEKTKKKSRFDPYFPEDGEISDTTTHSSDRGKSTDVLPRPEHQPPLVVDEKGQK